MILAGPEHVGRQVGSGSGTGNGAPVGAGRPLVPEQPAEVEMTDAGAVLHQPEG